MYRIALVLSILLIATPLSAQTSTQTPGLSQGASHSFGVVGCPKHFVCPGDSDATSTTDLIANANACVSQYLGGSSASGFFDETMGLNLNNCLTAKPDVFSKGMGTQLTPQCCTVTLSDNTCTFRCELVTVH